MLYTFQNNVPVLRTSLQKSVNYFVAHMMDARIHHLLRNEPEITYPFENWGKHHYITKPNIYVFNFNQGLVIR